MLSTFFSLKMLFPQRHAHSKLEADIYPCFPDNNPVALLNCVITSSEKISLQHESFPCNN